MLVVQVRLLAEGPHFKIYLCFDSGMKLCSRCGKPGEFAKNASKWDGLNCVCRACQSIYGKAHYVANRSSYVARAKARAEWLHAIVDEAKNRPCVDCGQKFHPVAMDLDHVRGKKVLNLADARRRGFSEARLRAEISKCEVRCAVCHRLRTHGIAPVLTEQATAFEAV